MFDVVALGELLIDFTYVDAGYDGYPIMAAHPGGAPCNLLAALAKSGAATALLGKVGSDRFGNLLRSTLDTLGIDTSGLVSDHNAFTTLAFVDLDEHGERSFSFARKPGADTLLRPDEVDLSIIEQCRIFHFGSLSLTHEPARSATHHAIEYAKSLGRVISFDPNLRPPLWDNLASAKEQILWGLDQADIVKISDDEVDFLYGLKPDLGARFILDRHNAKLVFVTCGAEGCWYDNGTVSGHTEAPQGLPISDTTGTGDIFGGSALWKLLQTNKKPEDLTGSDLHDITRFACAAASLSATRPGGIPSVPDCTEVQKLIESIWK